MRCCCLVTLLGCCLVTFAVAAFPSQPAPGTTRRALLRSLATAAAVAPSFAPSFAELPGTEDAYKFEAFDDAAQCVRRTPLGACAEQGRRPATEGSAGALKLLAAPTGPDIEPDGLPSSDYINQLRQRTRENKEKNDREVLEKTVKASLPGGYGPLATAAPVMLADGSFEDVPLALYNRLKDGGKIVKSRTGLDTFVEGFDSKQAAEQQRGWFGLF